MLLLFPLLRLRLISLFYNQSGTLARKKPPEPAPSIHPSIHPYARTYVHTNKESVKDSHSGHKSLGTQFRLRGYLLSSQPMGGRVVRVACSAISPGKQINTGMLQILVRATTLMIYDKMKTLAFYRHIVCDFTGLDILFDSSFILAHTKLYLSLESGKVVRNLEPLK